MAALAANPVHADAPLLLDFFQKRQQVGAVEIVRRGFMQQPQIDSVYAQFPEAMFERMVCFLFRKTGFGLEGSCGLCNAFANRRHSPGDWASHTPGDREEAGLQRRLDAILRRDCDFSSFSPEEFSQTALGRAVPIRRRNVEVTDSGIECCVQQAKRFALAQAAHQAGASEAYARGPARGARQFDCFKHRGDLSGAERKMQVAPLPLRGVHPERSRRAQGRVGMTR